MPRHQVIRELDLPIAESSGLCAFPGKDGGIWLATVGDANTTLALGRMTDEGELDWLTHRLETFAGAPEDLGQLEAVEFAGGTRLLMMGEEPSLVALVDVAGKRFDGSWHLTGGMKFRRLWDDDENSRGEALVLGPRGHVLVVKEKGPVTVIEFGPEGDEPLMTAAGGWPVTGWEPPSGEELVALDWTDLSTLPGGAPADVSDACAIDGEIMLLSDQERDVRSLTAAAGAWTLGPPMKLDRMISKPEGLTCLPDGRWLVSMDMDDLEGNLVQIQSLR